MIKALIFDFDGLILETEMPDYIAWREVYQQHGVDLALEVWAQVVGSNMKDSPFDPYTYLEQLIGRNVDREAIRAWREPRYTGLVAQERILPGVGPLLREAKARKVKLAIASSSPRSWVEGHAGRLNILNYFDVICTADDVPRTKPDPALYTLALQKLGVQASEAVVFEDSPNGITAARRAGIFVIAVPTGLTARLDLSHADQQVSSLLELNSDSLLLISTE